MEDYPHALTVEGPWPPSSTTKTLTTKLQIYFQSKKKSQGGDCVVKLSEQTNVATVCFKSEEIRDQVLAKKKHSLTIDSQEVNLKVFKPGGADQTERNSGVTVTGVDAAGSSQQKPGKGNDVAGSFQQQDAVSTGPKPLSVRVDNLPADAITNKDYLELCFEKWGGPVQTISTIPKEQAAVITFQSPDAVQKILDGTGYHINKMTVIIRPYKESEYQNVPPTQSSLSHQDPSGGPTQSSAVVLEKLPDVISRDFLLLLVESVSGLHEEEFSLEFVAELNVAVMIFNDPSVAEKFLMDSRSHKKFQQFKVMGRFLEKITSIKVENLPKQATRELLELYFDKWGGAVERVNVIPEEQAAIVTFLSQAVAEKTLERKHSICNTPVNVYPYFTSLGTALYGQDRPTWILPRSFTEKIHPAVWEFLHMKGLISSISNRMDRLYCQINMDQAEVQLSPLPGLLRQKDLTKKQIDTWSQTVKDGFEAILSNYGVFEHAVLPSVWATVEKDIRSVVKDKAVLQIDDGVLTLAGMAQDIKLLKPILEDVLKKASNQMERGKNSASDSMEMSPAMFSLLLNEGMQKTAKTKYPDLKLTYKKDTNQLMMHGLPHEMMDIKNWILERRISMKLKTLTVDPSLLDFLRSVNCEEMSEDLFTSKGIRAVYRVEKGNVVLTGSSDTALTDAEKRLQTVLTSSSLSLEDLGVLEKPEWRSLSDQLCDTYNSSRKKTVLIKSFKSDKIAVSGFKDPVSEVSRQLEDFIDKHSRTEEVINVKSYAVTKFIQEKKTSAWKKFVKPDEVKVIFDSKRPLIRLSGERLYVMSAMTNFKKIAEALHSDKLTVDKAGAKKYFQEQGTMFLMMIKDHRFVVVLEESHMLEEDEDDADDDSLEGLGQLSCEVQVPGGVIITVRKADMCNFKVDAVVNAANEDLQHIGGLALALLKAAGQSLQECSDRYVAANGRVPPGHAVTTEAGRLPCKYVVHAVGPRYTAADQLTGVRRLRQAVRESLKEAMTHKCSSIALPAISSGVFGFPLELCTETIAKELRAYVEYHKHQGGMNMLTVIHLVDNNFNTVNAMAQAVKKEFAEFKPKMTFPQQKRPHGQGYRGHGKRGRGRGNRGNSYHGHGSQTHGYRGQGARGHGQRDSGSWNNESQVHRANEFEKFEAQEFTTGQISKQLPRTYSKDWDMSGSLETQLTQERLRITLKKGNLQDSLSGVIVNTIAEDVDLSKGAVSNALLQAAGPQLQSEASDSLSSSGSSKLSYGAIVVTGGYNLNCQWVFHTVCPFWNGGTGSEVETMKHIITECLRKAERQKMASISFPAIGTGNLGFPRELVSSILLRTIHEFSARDSAQYLKEVTVVVHPSDNETVQCFIKNFRGGKPGPITKGAHAIQQSPKKSPVARSSQSPGLFGVVSTPTLGVHTMQVGHLTLEVSSGDITREKCDAIVNSSNASFSLKSGVSKAILDAAGLAVEQECAQTVQASLQQKEIIMTSGGQLLCRNIIHIIGRNSPAAIKDVVYSVLKLCEAQKFSSVAFPALGTGQGGASPSAVADAMIDAVVDFVKKRKGVHLQSVKFLIFQTSMVSDFHQSMLKRQQEGGGEDSTVLGWIKEKFNEVSSLIMGDSTSANLSAADEEFVMVGEEFEPAVFQLCAESHQDLSEARELITSFIVKEQTSSSIRDSAINHFIKEDAETLTNLQRELSVSIQVNKSGPEPVITLEGLTRDVVKAESTIRDMIRKVEKNESRKREAFMVSSLVEWQYLNAQNQLVPFDIFTNYDLEDALRQRQPRVKITIHGEQYEAEVIRGVAVGSNRRIELKRVDKKEETIVSLPKHWEDMKGGSHVKRVSVKQGTQEYSEVENKFRRTGLQSTILEIERVQNSTLWKSYMIRKKHLEDKNKHTKNEKELFHGTGPDNIDKINDQGFNRSYAGMNGAAYGNGVYFAVDPKYSAGGYSRPDRQGHKRMYLARVLIGDYTTGKSGLVAPPAKSTTSVDTYDSVTDNQQNPSMFVIFHDVQAYPEYLITFQ